MSFILSACLFNEEYVVSSDIQFFDEIKIIRSLKADALAPYIDIRIAIFDFSSSIVLFTSCAIFLYT